MSVRRWATTLFLCGMFGAVGAAIQQDQLTDLEYPKTEWVDAINPIDGRHVLLQSKDWSRARSDGYRRLPEVEQEIQKRQSNLAITTGISICCILIVVIPAILFMLWHGMWCFYGQVVHELRRPFKEDPSEKRLRIKIESEDS